jgi:predicted TIM-barrel fold metal-dependent hydrolase
MNLKYNAIDADAHVLEPGDLWTSYLEAKFKDQAPGLRREANGKEVFRIDDNSSVDLVQQEGGVAVAGGIGMREGQGPTGNAYSDGKPGGFNPHLRIPDMDSEGIDAAFLFPTLGLFLGGIRDTEMAVASFRAYNRWVRDYCVEYPDRLFGIAMIPMRSPEDAVAEIKYASQTLGLRAAMVSPIMDNNRPLHDPANDPVWRAAQDHNVSIAVHAAVPKTGVKVLGDDRFTEESGSGSAVKHCAGHMLEMASAVFSFVMNRVCDKFPELRVGFMEAGGGWIGGCLDRMDRHFDDIGANDTGLTLRPSEIFRRQCFISFEPVEGTLPLLAEYIGRTNILWATDYPHVDGFTGAPAMIRKMPMPKDLLNDVLVTGAKRFYGLV